MPKGFPCLLSPLGLVKCQFLPQKKISLRHHPECDVARNCHLVATYHGLSIQLEGNRFGFLKLMGAKWWKHAPQNEQFAPQKWCLRLFGEGLFLGAMLVIGHPPGPPRLFQKTDKAKTSLVISPAFIHLYTIYLYIYIFMGCQAGQNQDTFIMIC